MGIKKKNSPRERIKTALIILLCVSAVLLGGRTGLFSDFMGSLPLFGHEAGIAAVTAAPQPGTGVIQEAALPSAIVITGSGGVRYGVRYDDVRLNAVYERTGGIVSEALKNAETPEESSESEWEEALNNPGIFYEYAMPVRLSVLHKWLGTEISENVSDIPIRRAFISFFDNGECRFFFQDSDSGVLYRGDTVCSGDGVSELYAYTENGAGFAFETGIAAAGRCPYFIVLRESEHPAVRAAAAGSPEDLMAAVITAIGHSRETYAPPYFADDGAYICVGTQFDARVEAQGRVVYRRIDVPGHGGSAALPGESDLIETSRYIAQETAGKFSGRAAVYFDSVEYGDDDTVTVTFSYHIAGGKISLPGGEYAAALTFYEGNIREIRLNFRAYSIGDTTYRLLPELQTLAATGGEFYLCYSDTGAESMRPFYTPY